MNSRQKTGILIFILGMFLFLGEEFPKIFSIIRDYITFPVILMIIGVYLVIAFNNKPNS